MKHSPLKDSASNDISSRSIMMQRFTTLLLIVLGAAVGAVTVLINNPLRALAALSGFGIALLVFVKVEIGFIALTFITHSNLSTVFIEQFNAPSIAKILVVLVLIGIIFRYSIRSAPPSGLLPITTLMALYAISGLISMLDEAHLEAGITTLFSLAKDSVIAIIAVILLRSYSQLRATFWALIASGALLGTVAIYQHLTGTFGQNYWGLSLAPTHHIIGSIDDHRLSGTLGDPNFFAMFQFILLPLALDRLITEKRVILKLIAAYAFGAILFTVIFTYSRGGFLGITMMLLVFVCFKRQSVWQIVILIIIGIAVLSYTPQSNYIDRMMTMEYLSPGKKHHPIAEGSFQGRKSEMLVAIEIFLDNPITGVGLGNYELHYQKYAQKLFSDFRRENRESHCRYLEILAETGLVGFFAFCLLLWYMFSALLKARIEAIDRGAHSLERAILALIISLCGLLTGYIFLHDAWPRLSWLLIGIAFAIPNIFTDEESGMELRPMISTGNEGLEE